MNWRNQLGFDPLSGSGWIPPHDRTSEMNSLNREVLAAMPTFGEVNDITDLPDEALLCDLEIKATGTILPRVWQKSGSCVGAAAAMAYAQAACGDVVHRGDNEQVKHCFPWATYGIGRKLAGMTRTGEGSFGSAQAKAVKEWGMIPIDDARLPQGKVQRNWLVWDAKTEIEWSHPSNWPIAETTLRENANQFQILDTAQVRQAIEVRKALAQGYGVTLASMFGTRNERVIDGYLMAEWNDSWAHQMSCGGYATHPSQGIIYWIQNQWYYNAHPECPKMSALGVNGGFWIRENVLQKIISTGEVFIHSNTEGFPPRPIKWRSWV